MEELEKLLEELSAFKESINMKLDKMNDDQEKLKENVNVILAHNRHSEGAIKVKYDGETRECLKSSRSESDSNQQTDK